ncbi:MAG: helix-turn-helix domain-containing protein [Clostridia bacterium]|nr:helix-turn-helix domain-containing protein [Clostridia bacterium]
MQKYSQEEKAKVIGAYKAGNSDRKISQMYGIPKSTVRLWCQNYEVFGEEIYKEKKNYKKWSNEIKVTAVREYLDGHGSIEDICKKYKISTSVIFRRWILWYNGHREIKERTSAKGEIYMTKGRKTTQEERAEIVAFCIEHNKDYGLTVETYKVSYQQIYAWVRKYEEGGVDKLKDNRGRTKPVEEMTEVEKLKAEMKMLEAKNRQLEIENEFIKKLQELIGGGR